MCLVPFSHVVSICTTAAKKPAGGPSRSLHQGGWIATARTNMGGFFLPVSYAVWFASASFFVQWRGIAYVKKERHEAVCKNDWFVLCDRMALPAGSQFNTPP